MEVDNKKIAKNTLMLYLRMLFSMCVSLYTSRVILATLGVTDFGINNVILGVTGMLSFLSSAMSGATARFLTYAIGKGDKALLKKTFSAAFTIHLLLAIIIFILCETVGIWMLENKLVIPPDRMMAARIIFQFSAFSCLLGIAQIPFSSALIAHERMDIFAYFGIADVVLKLVIVYLLTIFNYDKLILYGALFFIVSLGMMIINRWYGITHFEECRFKLSRDKNMIIPMLKFSGWDLYGNMSVMARTEGVNILQNMFWGPTVNAATGVANQVMTTILGFSNNFLTAIRPQIVKLYAQEQIQDMQILAERSSKFSFFLLFFISFPCFLELPFVLNLWLVNVPNWTVSFTRLSMLFNWNVTIFLPLMYIIHATGRMKRISFINGTLYLMVLPITWFLFKEGLNPTTPFILNAIFVLLGAGISNLYSIKLYIPSFQCLHYLKYSVMNGILTVALGSILPIVVKLYMPDDWMGFLIVCSVSVLSLGLSILYVGLNMEERKNLVNLILKKIHVR
jgi:O-antigen/teichoic acid export membrane protein